MLNQEVLLRTSSRRPFLRAAGTLGIMAATEPAGRLGRRSCLCLAARTNER
jgi:hypothetical protein